MFSQADLLDRTTNKFLSLIILPTEKCNLRCIYCYEGHHGATMAPETARSIGRLIEARVARGLERLEIQFFGGEPLVAWPVVASIVSQAVSVARGNGVAFNGGMTTNATLLTTDRAHYLVERGFSFYQITLDGPQAVHDARRCDVKRKGSFRQVMAGLAALKELAVDRRKLQVMIRLHYAPDTLAAIADASFIEELAGRFIAGDDRFSISPFVLGRLGGPNDSDLCVFDAPEAASTGFELLKAAALSAGCAPEQIVAPPDGICYAAAANSLVVRSDGRLSKCTVALDNDANVIGRLDADGRIQVDNARYLSWVGGLAAQEEDWLCCPRRYIEKYQRENGKLPGVEMLAGRPVTN